MKEVPVNITSSFLSTLEQNFATLSRLWNGTKKLRQIKRHRQSRKMIIKFGKLLKRTLLCVVCNFSCFMPLEIDDENEKGNVWRRWIKKMKVFDNLFFFLLLFSFMK